jgi:hypothetical protein
VLPLALLLTVFDPFGILRPELPEDLIRLIAYPPCLVFGFLVFSDGRIQQAIIRQRRISLALAVALTLGMPMFSSLPGLDSSFPVYALVMSLASLLSWSSILAILGYGMRYLTAGHRLLSYANEAVLPFYILHQPVILILGYFVIPLPLTILAKYLIIASTAFGITLGMYELGVRRVNPIRLLFGLKPRKPALPVADLAAQPVS